MIDALIGAGASLLGGFMANQTSASSVEKQMEFQQRANAQNMAFNKEEAQTNRDWQERMSSSAHQREVSDLRLAGLNPILSVNRSGAATGAGAQATGVTSAGSSFQARNPAEGAASSALAAAGLSEVLARIKVAEAQADNIKAQTITEVNRPENIFADTQLKQTQNFSEGYKGLREASQHDLNQAEEARVRVATTIARETGIPLAQAQTAAARTLAALQSNTAKSADVKARLDAAYSEAERIISMGEGATSAVRNLTPIPKLGKK